MPHLPIATVAEVARDVVRMLSESAHDPSMSNTSTMQTLSLASAAPYPGFDQQHNPLSRRTSGSDRLYTERQQLQVHDIAIVTGCLSIVAELCAIYWFFMMRRNFRRTLVFLLILGDFWKSLWYMAFSAASFARLSTIPTSSAFCQAGGLMLQSGVLACDLAVFLMSLHMALQIFPPTRLKWLGDDGLYRVRYWVYGIWIMLPMTLASFAFINPTINGGFVFQAAFCTMPYRPYWVRLVLHWIPRYLIVIYIMVVALRIYYHVRTEFKLLSTDPGISTSFDDSQRASQQRNSVVSTLSSQPNHAIPDMVVSRPSMSSRRQSEESVAPDENVLQRPGPLRTQSGPQRIESRPQTITHIAPRRLSVPAWTAPHNRFESIPEGCRSDPASRRDSGQCERDNLPYDFAAIDFSRRGSTATFGAVSFTSSAFEGGSLPPIAEGNYDGGVESQISTKVRSGEDPLKARRRAIQRQLRLLFLYPVVYLLMWTIPFVNHCFFYSDHFLRHPVFPLGAITVLCQTLLGFVDVCIFCSREQPWRHIPGSDGTFLGSFKLWRFSRTEAWHNQRHTSMRRTSSIPIEAPVEVKSKVTPTKLVGGIINLTRSRNDSATSSTANPRTPSSRPGSLSRSITTPGTIQRRVTSGGSDRKQAQTDLAYERLALERQEAEQARNNWGPRRSSVLSGHRSSTGSRNWFDRKFSEDIGVDVETSLQDRLKIAQMKDEATKQTVEEELAEKEEEKPGSSSNQDGPNNLEK